MCEPARCGYQSIPRAGKTQIPRVQKNEGKIAANGVHYLWIGRGQRRSGGKNVRSVANDRHARGFYSLCDDPRSHVLAENDDAIGAPQRPAVKFFPDSREDAQFDDRASHSHVRVQIPSVVRERFAFQHGNERADDALKRRIGHGQHDVAVNK